MKKLIKYSMMFLVAGFFVTIQAQPMQHGYINPDTLTTTSVSGLVITDSSHVHPLYYLDTDRNGSEDYILNFGPYWYEPDNSSAKRPTNGDDITITGGSHENMFGQMETIIVYEIGDEFWRAPNEAFWNNMYGSTFTGGRKSDCFGYANGWDYDSTETVTLTGITVIDSTFFNLHYYLDESGDGIIDYFLNFGPPWYSPENGLLRPMDGETITVDGIKMNSSGFPMVIVTSLNNNSWRDTSFSHNRFGGNWIIGSHNFAQRIHSPYDSLNWMEFAPGWHSGGMMDDSLFCQILEIYPQNVPFPYNSPVIAAFETGIFRTNRQNKMWQNGNCGGSMSFNSGVKFQFHYHPDQFSQNSFSEQDLTLRGWDQQNSSWVELENITFDDENDIISSNSSTAYNFIIVTVESSTAFNEGTDLPTEIQLKQNYPNPFNPTTNISFNLSHNDFVSLRIYNIIGELQTELLNGQLSAGIHNISFNAANLPTGVYLYELTTTEFTKTKKMMLIK